MDASFGLIQRTVSRKQIEWIADMNLEQMGQEFKNNEIDG